MFEVLHAPMHAVALHSDTGECLASCCWQHDRSHAWASESTDVGGATGTNAMHRMQRMHRMHGMHRMHRMHEMHGMH